MSTFWASLTTTKHEEEHPVVITQEKKQEPVDFMEQLAELQALLHQVNITEHEPYFSCPSLVLVGSQSAGKTTLINRFANHKLLPTSNLMSTRCAMQITLKKSLAETTFCIDNFTTLDSHTFYTTLQQKVATACENKAVAAPQKLIHVKFRSPHVLGNLTFIDLPGVIQVCDQDAKLPQEIEQLIQYHIQNPQNIIIAAIPARPDVEADVILGLLDRFQARDRALGALLKVDLLNPKDKSVLERRLTNNQLARIGFGYKLVDNPPTELMKHIYHLLKMRMQKALPTLREQVQAKIGVAESAVSFRQDIAREELVLTDFVTKQMTKLKGALDSDTLGENVKGVFQSFRGAVVSQQSLCESAIPVLKQTLNTGFHLQLPRTSTLLAKVEITLPHLFSNIFPLAQKTVEQLREQVNTWFSMHSGESGMDVLDQYFTSALQEKMELICSKKIPEFIETIIQSEQSLFWTSNEKLMHDIDVNAPNFDVFVDSFEKEVRRTVFADLVPKYVFFTMFTPILNLDVGWIREIVANMLKIDKISDALQQREMWSLQLQSILEKLQSCSC